MHFQAVCGDLWVGTDRPSLLNQNVYWTSKQPFEGHVEEHQGEVPCNFDVSSLQRPHYIYSWTLVILRVCKVEMNSQQTFPRCSSIILPSFMSVACTRSVLHTPEPEPIKMTAVIIFTDTGLRGSGMYKTDFVQARNTKSAGGLWLSLLYLPSKSGKHWIYGVWVMPSSNRVLQESVSWGGWIFKIVHESQMNHIFPVPAHP